MKEGALSTVSCGCGNHRENVKEYQKKSYWTFEGMSSLLSEGEHLDLNRALIDAVLLKHSLILSYLDLAATVRTRFDIHSVEGLVSFSLSAPTRHLDLELEKSPFLLLSSLVTWTFRSCCCKVSFRNSRPLTTPYICPILLPCALLTGIKTNEDAAGLKESQR